jgi:hypothetical protein
MYLGASLASLNLKMVVPVWISASHELPKAWSWIRDKEGGPPALVLLDVNSLMRTYACEFFLGDGQDDLAKDDASEGQPESELAAADQALAIGDFQRSRDNLDSATKSQWHGGQ